ncbi:PIN and XPG domain-containing protein [Aspergillus udagawae]|uniref:Asteroid domain-containing protein n=1 Tax=Aspergillus udagawae TaxID=91492 RepID=A0A8E0UUM1_9EURO|nr:uncharacterized protein Aud_002846 [Aspergillus udagawae]GIC86472.1 hypothetical protein Aud_002846 [Aspergillus udagawae]
MGIPHLTRLLLPYSEAVLLKGGQSAEEGRIHIQSVVIDGPSLVYHVHSRLLGWSDSRLEFPDMQPSCNEVSCGVMLHLLKLRNLGVDIKAICFDGALPARKRETRRSRLERARRKLEIARKKISYGSPNYTPIDTESKLETILRGRALTPKHRECPDNPFMVPAVFEDLKHRWNKENILQAVRGSILLVDSAALQDFPWADVTIMVAGEADMHCAYLAKLTGSAILTNDSDLILHDIGPHGTVVLLHSLELENTYSGRLIDVPLQAVQLHPASLAQRFGLADLLRLAYELRLHPNSGLTELIRLAKKTLGPQGSAGYLEFSEEYKKGPEHAEWGFANSHHLDPRVSELVWQYETQENNSWDEFPRFYLAILNEDHTRRCAWENGFSYRVLGYSIFNASRPPSRRSCFIDEFVRRGGRIARDTLAIRDAGWIADQMTAFYARLSVVRDALGENAMTTNLWRIFALCEIYGLGDSGSPLPDAKPFSRFLNFGYMGDQTDWADIHLTAQVQAVLYSLRIMRQLIGFTTSANDLMLKIQDALMSLPPLHVLMRSRFEMVNEYLTEDAAGEFLKRYKQLAR